MYRVIIDGTDATDDVVELSWSIGVRRPEDRVGISRGRIVLDNESGQYAPEQVGALALAQGALVVIEAEDGAGWRRLFTGEVEYAEPSAGEFGQRMATLAIAGAESRLARCFVRVGLRLNVGADEAVEAVLDHPDLAALPRDIGTTSARFASFGEQWGGGAAAIRIVQAVAQAEGGRFAADRDGVLVYRGRGDALSAGGPAATLDRLGEGASYTYGGEVYNRIRVGVRPRRVGAPNTTLWTLDGPQRLRPNRDLTLIVRLRTPDGRTVGAASVEPPVSGSDFTANTQPDGSGADATGQVGVYIVAVEGGAVRLRVENTGANAVYLMPGARLRGTPVIGGDTVWVERSSPSSAAAFGPRTLSVALPLLDSVESGEERADFELAGRANPRGQLRRLTLSERAGLGHALARSLFDRVRILDPHTGHDAVYTIIGEAHRISMGGARHQTVWTLERLPQAEYWTVGVAPLGVESRLAV